MRIERSPRTVFTPLEDGTGVLLNLDTLLYYSLNRTGSSIWTKLDADGAHSLEELVDHTCNHYDVEEDVARSSIDAFIGRLNDLKMVRLD